jgi:hypothetical protein
VLSLLGVWEISYIICHGRGKKEAFGNLGIIFAISAIGLVGPVVGGADTAPHNLYCVLNKKSPNDVKG